MSDFGEKWYVVFFGRKPGIYDDWLECVEQVLGRPDSLHKAYPTRAMAEKAWRKHLKKQKQKEAKEEIYSSNTQFVREPTLDPTQTAGLEFVPDQKPEHFLGHYPMQMWLRQAWNHLHTSEPMYTRHDYNNGNGTLFYRYRVSLKSNLFRFKSVSVFGRYAYTDEEAKEDAAFKMMKILAQASHKTVWDFNYDTMVELQQRVQKLEADNFDIILENGLLKEEIRNLKKQIANSIIN